MNQLDEIMAAKANRDAIRDALVKTLKAQGLDLPSELLGLLQADAIATAVLGEALARFEPVGALPNGSLTVELVGKAA